MRTRVGWASGIAVLGLCIALVLSGQAVSATQGEAVLAGIPNTADATTSIHNITGFPDCTATVNDGLQACGDVGVFGLGNTGVLGDGATVGVRGQSISGTGVLAAAPNRGTALKVKGRVQLSRSGVVVVPSGQTSVIVTDVALGPRSMVFATAQGFIPPGTYARAAVPDINAKTITIFMNTTMPADVPVAWMIVEHP
jgi:hypothetical protein